MEFEWDGKSSEVGNLKNIFSMLILKPKMLNEHISLNGYSISLFLL